MSRTLLTRAAAVMLGLLSLPAVGFAADTETRYLFNVLNHRSVELTARYWNPILVYVARKSGVPLELRLNKTSKENTAIAETGAYHFLYTNHFFTPARDKLGFRVIARPAGPDIRSQIIVTKESDVKSLKDLEGREIAFPTPDGFTGYWLPMDQLLRSGLKVKPVFSGSQESSFGQLRAGKVAGAGVNSVALESYARREKFEYRVLWTSDMFKELCIMAAPSVPKDKITAVQAALIGMVNDPEGRKILQAGAELLKATGEIGFVHSDNREYDNYRAFYRNTLVRDHHSAQ